MTTYHILPQHTPQDLLDFQTCEGKWFSDIPSLDDIDYMETRDEIAKGLENEFGCPFKVTLYHSNGLAITSECPDRGVFLVQRISKRTN